MPFPGKGTRIVLSILLEFFLIGVLSIVASIGFLVSARAMGWRTAVMGPGHIVLDDGTQMPFSDRFEARDLKEKYRGRIAGGTNHMVDTPLKWVSWLIPFVVFGACVAYRSRRRLRAWFRFDRRSVLLAFGALAGAQAVLLTYVWVVSRFGVTLPPFPWRPADPVSWSVFAVWVVLVAPVVEELIFRGRAFDALAEGFGQRVALVATSLVFAALHVSMANLAVAPVYLTLAFVLGWTRLRTGKLVAPVIIHVVNNAVAAVVIACSAPPS